MRWEITKKAWALARRQFAGVKSLYVSMPIRFKMAGDIPVYDLSSKNEIGSMSYKVISSPSDTTLVLQCNDEQVAHVLPPARMMTFATSRKRAEITGSGVSAREFLVANTEDRELKLAALLASEVELLSPENSRKWVLENEFPAELAEPVCNAVASLFGRASTSMFNYRSAKAKTERNVKDFPAVVHVVQDGNAMIVADVFQVRRIRHKNKQYEWWQIRPAGSSKMFWVLSDFIRPIKAGTVVAATAPSNQVTKGMVPVSSFSTDEVIWLQDKRGQLFGPLYVVMIRTGATNQIQVMPSTHGFVLYPGMRNNFGDFLERHEREEWVNLNDYVVMAGEWRYNIFRGIAVGDEFKVLGREAIWQKLDDQSASSNHGETMSFDGLDAVYKKDPGFHLRRFDPWRQVTGPGNEEALREAKKILEPGTAITLKSRGSDQIETMGTFERWEQLPNRMNPSQRGPKAMVIKIDDTGTTINVIPNSEQREWDVKVYGATTIEDAFSQGHTWATCNDPVMDDPIVRTNLVKGLESEVPEKIVAILSIDGDEVLARAGDTLVRVPKSSLKPAVKSDKMLSWVRDIQTNRHPYLKDDVLLRDGKKYVVISEPTSPELKKRMRETVGPVIPVQDETGKEVLIPSDQENKYIGISMGSGRVGKPMSVRSKELRTKVAPKEELPHPVSTPPMPPPPPLPQPTPEI